MMIMAQIINAVLFLVLLTQPNIMISHSSPLPSSSLNEKNHYNNYVEDACSVTLYRDICVQSLSSFSNKAKNNPSRWARAGVSVTIAEAKRAAQYLATLNKNATVVLRGRNRIALSDCVECFGDTLDNLHRSLGVLRRLGVAGFVSDMEDVTTWVSAALTDEDTCLDGFDGERRRRGRRVRSVINRVSKVGYMTSNALALINKLATTGPECLVG